MSRSRKKRLGATLVELLTGAAITILVLVGSMSILVAGSASWAQGLGKIGAETDAQMSVRLISQDLAEAMSVTVDSNGEGLTYRLPSTDGSGNYLLPVTWDGITRRIQVQGNSLVLTAGSATRFLAKDLIFTDPLSANGTGSYQVFTPGPGTVTREVTIEIVTSRSGYRNKTVHSRSRETIFLRNIPVLTK